LDGGEAMQTRDADVRDDLGLRALGRSTTSTAVPVAAARTASTCSDEVRDTRIGPSLTVRSRSTIARTSPGVLPSA
jgi:hypothetical protein